ncbi:MAG TPA: hypothetical protein VID26_11730 [Candidatus Limnocylindrales bacterium]
MSATLHVLRVFVDADDAHGNALGVGLEIVKGRGSRLTTRLAADGSVELGGRVVLDGTRPDG